MAVVEEGNDPVHRGQPLHYALSFYLFLSLPLLFILYPFSLSLAIPQSQTEHSCALLSVYVPTVHRRTNERYHLTHTHMYAVVLYTCVYVPGRRLRAPPIFMVRYGTKIKEVSRIASRYSLVNTSLACFVSRKRIVGIHSGRSRIDFSM